MGTMVFRSHDCFQNPLPADVFGPSPPAKSRPEANRRPHAGPPPRQTGISANTAALAGSQAPSLSRVKPFRGRDSHGRCAAPVRHGRCAAPVRHGRRRRTPENDRRRMVVKRPVKKLVMEEVTILRRGQAMGALSLAAEDRRPSDREGNAAAGGDYLELCSTGRLGPDPEILPKQIRMMDQKPHLYAGSGFITSPPPSSLPLPTSFLAKKDAADTVDVATRGLRCLLRLDLS